MRNQILIFFFFTLLISCNSSSNKKVDVTAVNVDYSISRFDIDFYSSDETSLQNTKNIYPHFFDEKTPDSVWINKINNKDERALFLETQKVFFNFEFTEKQLTSLFKYIKFYNPDFKPPNVTTLLSNIDYRNKVIYTEDMLLISLDVYLGREHPFYVDFPKYIKQSYQKNHIVVDVALEIIKKQISFSNDRTFLGKMIHEGKKMYLLDLYLEEISDEEKIGYDKDKYNWAVANESQVWKYFIENKMLFNTDTKLNKRFIENAPFSKFYREEDNLSPGKIGVWIGWQIVRSYMKHNDVSLQELLKISSEDLYKKSKYKPRK